MKLSGRPLTQHVRALGLVPRATQYMSQHSEEYEVAERRSLMDVLQNQLPCHPVGGPKATELG